MINLVENHVVANGIESKASPPVVKLDVFRVLYDSYSNSMSNILLFPNHVPADGPRMSKNLI